MSVSVLLILGRFASLAERSQRFGAVDNQGYLEEASTSRCRSGVQVRDEALLGKKLRNDHVVTVGEVCRRHCNGKPARGDTRFVRCLGPRTEQPAYNVDIEVQRQRMTADPSPRQRRLATRWR